MTSWRCHTVIPHVPGCRIGQATGPVRVRHSWTSCDAGWRAGLFALTDGICADAAPKFSVLSQAAVPSQNYGELAEIFWPNDPELFGGRVDFAA